MKHPSLPSLALLLLAGAMTLVTGCSSSNDSVLAVVERDTITVRTLTDYCRSLTLPVPAGRNERHDLLQRLIDFRLKAAEGRALGLESDSSLQADVAQQERDMAQYFLIDERLVQPGIRELYEMRRWELRSSHILIRFHHDYRGGLDTTRTREEAAKLLGQIQADPASFDSLAMALSEDGQIARNRGDLGWFVPGTTLPEMDRMLSGMTVGQIAPHLIRSRFGYHIFKLTGRQPLLQRMEAGHILYRLDVKTPDDTSAGIAHLTLILDSLRRGLASFEDLARRNSMDASSGPAGGNMGWVERGSDLDPNFEEALRLLKPGEVSPIVRTPYGLHLIKLISALEPRTLEEQEQDLKRTYLLYGKPIDYPRYLESLRREYAYSPSPEVIRRIASLMDNSMTTSSPGWEARIDPQLREAWLFRLSTGPCTVREAMLTIRHEPALQMRRFTPASLDSIALMIAEQRMLTDRARTIRDTSTRFHRLMNDFRAKALGDLAEQRQVFDHVAITDADVEAWWREHRSELRWPDRVNFSEIFVYDRRIAERLLDSLDAGADFAELARHHTRRATNFTEGGSWGWQPVDATEQARIASTMEVGTHTRVLEIDQAFSILRLNGREAAREKTFEEARPECLVRAREAANARASRAWLDTLRKRHQVQEYPDMLGFTNAEQN